MGIYPILPGGLGVLSQTCGNLSEIQGQVATGPGGRGVRGPDRERERDIEPTQSTQCKANPYEGGCCSVGNEGMNLGFP